MSATPPTASWPTAPAASEWLLYLGALPLVAALAAVGLASEYGQRELAQRLGIAWGAGLLAFSGAVHFGLALAGRLPFSARHLTGAVAPLIVAAAAVGVGGQRGLALLAVGFGLLWLYEHRVLGGWLPPQYLRVRRGASVAICLLLAVTMLVSDAVGLA